jgi:hypothetical protein
MAARTRTLELNMEIQAMIDLLEDYKKKGARTVNISDGAWHYEFNHRFMSVPNYDAPRDVILRPISNGDGREICFFETLEDRAKPHWSRELESLKDRAALADLPSILRPQAE